MALQWLHPQNVCSSSWAKMIRMVLTSHILSLVNLKNYALMVRTWNGEKLPGTWIFIPLNAYKALFLHLRWIKFEEDVEEGGDKWSKPHVATISLHSLFELRSCILNGTVMLDMEGSSLDQIAGNYFMMLLTQSIFSLFLYLP